MDQQQLPSWVQVSRDAVQPFPVPWSPIVPRIYIKGCARELKRRCIGYTSTWHRTQRELNICKRLLVHFGKHMNWLHMKPLQSYAKDIQHNWGMLPPHSCLSVTRKICPGGFGIRKCQSTKPK